MVILRNSYIVKPTVKNTYKVKPARQTPTRIMNLSEFDQILSINHAPMIYFYGPAGDELTVNAIEILKDSLSKALVIFYPLAGRLQWIARGRLELNCNSKGALLLEAESEAKIEDFGDFRPTPEIRALIPSVDYDRPIHELPLLLIQLTKFSCGGVSLGLGISHALVDSQSATHFVTEWATIARGEQPQNIPFLDRTRLLLPKEPFPPPNFDHSFMFGPPLLLIGQSNNLEERNKETAVIMLKLSKERIDKLKNKANEDRTSNNNNSSRAFTSFEAVAAHMWRCACRARRHQSEQLTSLRVAVDFQKRMDPPLPNSYFGNTILHVTATATSEELLSEPLAYASEKIRESIEKVTDDCIRSALVFLKSEPDLSKVRDFRVGRCNPNISINSWTKLPLHGAADFGWGKEIHQGPGVLRLDGKSFILPGRDEEGSFVIEFHLQVEHMDAFNKFFYENPLEYIDA